VRVTHKVLNYIEANVESFSIVISRLKGQSFMCALCDLDEPASYE
jgi:hypothetical protein